MNGTKKRIHAIFIITAIGVVLAVAGLLLLHSRQEVLTGPQLSIPVSIADTDAERQQGLSNTASLPANSGKLFVFDQPGKYGFWMKDMQYGLDFVWIGPDMKIVDLTPDVAASTYPQIFYPAQSVLYVLEVNAGFSTQHQLIVGEQLYLQK